MNTVKALLSAAATRLEDRVETPLLDAQVLLAQVLDRDRGWLYAWPEHLPDETQCAAFERLVSARERGTPVAHLIGRREFWSLQLKVTPETLIPRPETELLIEIALQLDLPEGARVLDMGTGSGAIALALASERPGWQITGTDLSPQALEVARQNARDLGLGRLQWHAGDWFDAIPTEARFDLIVSNPPYIAAGDQHLDEGDVRFEPLSALVSGERGLDDLETIIVAAPQHLASGGWLWLEHGYDQGAAVTDLLRSCGFEQLATRDDLAGHGRHSGGRWPGPDSSGD